MSKTAVASTIEAAYMAVAEQHLGILATLIVFHVAICHLNTQSAAQGTLRSELEEFSLLLDTKGLQLAHKQNKYFCPRSEMRDHNSLRKENIHEERRAELE
jgi:hypothetical protein